MSYLMQENPLTEVSNQKKPKDTHLFKNILYSKMHCFKCLKLYNFIEDIIPIELKRE